MQEMLEQLFNYLHGIWRFRWYAVLTAWIVAPLGWYYVYKMPDIYEASAQVYVDTDSILKPLLRGLAIDSMDISERLGMMTKALLSRPNLEKVLRDVDLDINVKSKQDYEALLRDLSLNIQIDASRTHRGPRPLPPNLYTISARNSDPQTAFKIVNSLMNIFLESSLGGNREDSNMAQLFLDKQIKEYEARLTAAEKRLREFKRQHIGTLPDQGQTFFQRLQAAQGNLDAINLEIREEQNRKMELMRQLQGISPNQRILSRDGAPILSPIEQRINSMQSRLDELLLKYTDQHPDVIETRRVLEELQKELTNQANRPGEGQSPNTAQNPMYQQVKIALGEVEANIAALNVRRDEYLKRVDELKLQIVTLPEVEAELTALNRDYEINKQNYDMLIKRREAAKIGEEAGKTGEESELKIIEPPRVPVTPTAPNRLILSSMVLLASLGAGIGLSFLLSQLKPSFYNLKMLRDQIDYPIFGSISMLSLPEIVNRRKMQLITFFMSNGLLVILFGFVVYINK